MTVVTFDQARAAIAASRNIVGFTSVSSIGNIVAVAVDTTTCEVELLSHHSILDCCREIVPQLVSGQLQGGLAMGIGHALHALFDHVEQLDGEGPHGAAQLT